MPRLFAALRPPPPVRDALIDIMDGIGGARWQDDDQLHLTLRFAGELDRPQAEDFAAALASVSAPGFDLTVRGAGHFARKGRATAVWAALAPAPALTMLQGRIERAARAAGLPPEPRKFVPHVTLARLGGGAAGAGHWLAAHGDLAAPGWPVRSFRLYESHLRAAGSVYECVAEWPLAPPACPTND